MAVPLPTVLKTIAHESRLSGTSRNLTVPAARDAISGPNASMPSHRDSIQIAVRMLVGSDGENAKISIDDMLVRQVLVF